MPAVLALVAAVTLVLGAAFAGPAFANEEDREQEAVEGVRDVVVALLPDSSVEDIARDHGLVVVRQLVGSTDVHLLRAPSGTDAVELSVQLSGDVRVRFAEPNYRGGMPEGDPNYAWGSAGPRWVGTDPSVWVSQPALAQVSVSGAHEATTGEGVVVAVLDTGVQPDHPVLAGRLVGGIDVLDGDTDPTEVADGLDDDGDGAVDEAMGHGTHVAGIVLAVAPDARIMPIRVLTADGVGFVFSVAEGIRYAVAAGADVINLSLGTTVNSALMREVIDEAEDDVVIVAAAGNEGTTARQYPAALEDVLSVASVDSTDVRSPFSNHGWVDVAAPGQDVVSSLPTDGYAAWDGTSMATPIVAGQAALLHAAGARDVEQLVLRTAVPLDRALGAGRVDVAGSVQGINADDDGDDGDDLDTD